MITIDLEEKMEVSYSRKFEIIFELAQLWVMRCFFMNIVKVRHTALNSLHYLSIQQSHLGFNDWYTNGLIQTVFTFSDKTVFTTDSHLDV